MRGLRNLLNKFKWNNEKGITIEIIHRGAKGNIKHIRFEDIVELGPFAMVLSNGTNIPYHRIVRITQNNIQVWPKTVGQ
ncbi:MAG: DUF504 domain-containing protein [Candidatus Diapherotrites archaeon]|nr:DUF504 domain-containing protein [Candidatus Diapherotrites archaeon]